MGGTVKDKITGAPIEGVQITINAPQHRARTNAVNPTRTMTTTTNAHGLYEMRRLPAGHYTLTMKMDGYIDLQVQVTIEDSGIAEANGEMERVSSPV